MSFVIFHPSVAPFVQQAARALFEAGQLEEFVTTIREDRSSWWQWSVSAAGKLAGRDISRQFGRRAVTEIPAGKVRAHPAGELLRLAVGALDRDGRATDIVWEASERAFDRRVSRSLRAGFAGVYGFEHSSLSTFHRARELGMRVVYDVPAPDSAYVRGLLAEELERFPGLRTAYHRHTDAREGRRLARRRAEWCSAHTVISASAFTTQSYAQAGLDTSKVRVIPYGAPPVSPHACQRRTVPNTALRILWAGTFSIRKGAHYALEAWRRADLGRHAELHAYGAVTLPPSLLERLPAGVFLHGSVPRSELLPRYGGADALLFPTLCDGFGMIATEAWSQGLPVITTDRAGAADLLRPGRNGLRIRAADSAAIVEAVEWCLDHRGELSSMREAAAATAAAWQWSDYRAALRTALAPEFAPAAV